MRAPRKDALERRAALIAAAAELFASDGYDVSLDKVATRAGVGRGTLYRNFPDRAGLALAVLDSGMAQIVRIADEHAGDLASLLGELARAGQPTIAVYMRVGVQLAQDPNNHDAFRQRIDLLVQAMAPAVARLRQRGELRDGVTEAEVALAGRMLAALLMVLSQKTQDVDAIMQRGVDLLLHGLKP